MLLVTGFPGFIARRLVAGVLERNSREGAVALIEPRMGRRAERAVADLGATGGRVRLVEGDITAPGLGLSDDVARELRGDVTRVLHLAAVYDLTVPRALAERVNVEGTGNVLDFVESCERSPRLGYFSTVQVAGDRTGRIYEHELQLGQGFKNHYEETKHRAEVWVRDHMERIPTTIFRPTIVVGDSRSGEIPKFDGPYYALELIRRLRARGLPVSYLGRSQAHFNLVPIDFVVEAAAHIFDQPGGRTHVPARGAAVAAGTRAARPALPPVGRKPASRAPAGSCCGGAVARAGRRRAHRRSGRSAALLQPSDVLRRPQRAPLPRAGRDPLPPVRGLRLRVRGVLSLEAGRSYRGAWAERGGSPAVARRRLTGPWPSATTACPSCPALRPAPSLS